jgi:hypothetical protein
MAHAHHQIKRRATAGDGTNVLVARAIYMLFAFIITIIILRIVFLMIGTGTSEPFANFIYAMSTVFVVPFFLIFGYVPTYGAPVFEISSLVAMLVYILIGWGLAILVTLGSWHSDEV